MLLKFLTIFYALITSGALVVLKLGSKDGAFAQFINGKLELNFTAFTVTGILLYGISFLLYMYLISKFELGYIIPLTTAIVYILVFAASFIVFKESFTAIKVIAIILIIGGVILLNVESSKISPDVSLSDSRRA